MCSQQSVTSDCNFNVSTFDCSLEVGNLLINQNDLQTGEAISERTSNDVHVNDNCDPFRVNHKEQNEAKIIFFNNN
jgi:hypothetical protein